VKRPGTVIAAVLALIAIVVGGMALVGGDGENTSTNPASNESATDNAPPPSAPGGLPPQFVECMAQQGYDIDSLDEMHSAPPQALQACVGSLHK
jgi:hypothetical protein